MKTARFKNLVRFAVMGAVVAVAVTGCSSNNLLSQYQSGDNKNYISGDGTVTEIKPADRSNSVEFTAKTDQGTSISRKTYNGRVVVLNFWYASCPPCRVEAPDLASLSKKYDSQGVQFIGVNVRDEADTARAFDRSFTMPYPSVVDATDAKVQLALAGQRGPNATPTTMVLDQKGRVAARVLGQVNKSVLDTLIADTLKEGK
ncbi:thiol-disulfide isomerase [Frondihabitans sucicola]|uniref:Thiol-disulfide isomerase n=1 Tax=Frondihabitans sucicola TaxID=1268041 RepID=A0ABM8GTH6_9MICO|nr:TlpA disulfide reductase family protein [Frondihabitans sucicola]BDZ51784.1 thiol-disulfide isomerase [Frondihabitans sucicola]